METIYTAIMHRISKVGIQQKLTIYFIGIFSLFANNAIIAQSACSKHTLNIKSGFDEVLSDYMAVGANDANWIIVQDAQVSTIEPRPSVVADYGYGLISYIPNSAYRDNDWSCASSKTDCSSISGSPCASWAGHPSAPPGLEYDFPVIANYSFCIAPETDLSSITFNFDYLADDFAKVCINGTYVSNTDPNGFSALTNAIVTDALFPGVFHTGVNVISVSFYNLGSGPVYFYFDGSLTTSVTGSDPFSSIMCCNGVGCISGQKFLDANSNGINDQGIESELGIVNWEIVLKDLSGTIISTVYTDVNGYYFFGDVLPGTYIIEEINQTGYHQTAPASTAYTITINEGQNVSLLDFGNAIGGPCSATQIQLPEGRFCYSNLVNMSAINCSNPLAAYSWSFGDGLTATGANVSHIYQYPGTYNIQLTIVQPDGESIVVNTSIVIEDCIEVDCKDCIGSFQPSAGDYIVSLWVKENLTPLPQSYNNTKIEINFLGVTGSPAITFGTDQTKNKIIDGWQRIEERFTIPPTATNLKLKLLNTGTEDAYFDDIRIFPTDGQMKTYVYDPVTLRLTATLDENNYATFYEYDEEGKLIRVKKETEKGIMTIQESREGIKKK